MTSDVLVLSPTLQYQATVKIIGTLLRNPEYGEMLKNVAWDRCYVPPQSECNEDRLDYMVEHLRIKANALPLPESLKIILNRSILFLAINTTHWLTVVGEMTPVRLQEEYWSKTIYELIKHLQWDNIGCVDGPRTLESYVSNRKTIDFLIWNLLCFHCMETQIRKFAIPMEWSKCKECFSSVFPVYWYKKVYGCLPSYKMYQRNMEDKIANLEKFKDENILESMFSWDGGFSAFGKTVSAIKYFRNYLKDDGKLVEWAGNYHFTWATDDVVLYLLKTINVADLFERSPSFRAAMGIIDPLFRLPLVLFIDDWISKFEVVGPEWFIYFFGHIRKFARGKMYDYNITVYEPLEKVWRIFYRRFREDREAMGEAFQRIVGRGELTACELMFEGLRDDEREYIIECGKYFFEQKGRKIMADEQFLIRFSNEILKNDKERELFSAIPNEFLSWGCDALLKLPIIEFDICEETLALETGDERNEKYDFSLDLIHF